MHFDPDVHLFLHRMRVAEAAAPRPELPVGAPGWWRRRRGWHAGSRAPSARWSARAAAR